MNRDWVLFHLREALEELQQTIRQIEQDLEYEEVELSVAMQHLYNHLNTAWNSREVSAARTANAGEDDFYRWRAFPADLHMGP